MRGDQIWAGQAAAAGGPQTASKRFIHSVSRCQAWGQVHSDLAAAVTGDPGGDMNEVAAQGGTSGLGAGEAGLFTRWIEA